MIFKKLKKNIFSQIKKKEKINTFYDFDFEKCNMFVLVLP